MGLKRSVTWKISALFLSGCRKERPEFLRVDGEQARRPLDHDVAGVGRGLRDQGDPVVSVPMSGLGPQMSFLRASAPVLVFPVPRPASRSQLVQLPGGSIFQRLDTAARELAAPQTHRVFARAEGFRNARAGPSRQRQQYRPRPIRLAAVA